MNREMRHCLICPVLTAFRRFPGKDASVVHSADGRPGLHQRRPCSEQNPRVMYHGTTKHHEYCEYRHENVRQVHGRRRWRWRRFMRPGSWKLELRLWTLSFVTVTEGSMNVLR
ncbi:hypothetical protein CDAR_244111 [Caerostris darwini]|uniref:Uncharacterized protein n=1 Tax=Caerostris darwini TaxID=1538125 RepID=A0AAV4REN0_9ARAC|nr:hypothetical protein CDAR_244111 [Caerostris darwini]